MRRHFGVTFWGKLVSQIAVTENPISSSNTLEDAPAELARECVTPSEGTPDGTGIPAGSFPVVGIGASAGGLAAFEAFFSGMPADVDPGMSFVLVQHLAPDHKSVLTELVQRYTRMQVFEIDDGMIIQPNCAYIIPPNRDLALLNGALHLSEPAAPRGLRLPIDSFFQSLAQDRRDRAICIVLSGTGSDGALGVRAVKGEGGMAMAQDPDSCEYDGMPRSAIATGLVDFVRPPSSMPAQLIAYVSHAFGKSRHAADVPATNTEVEFKRIFAFLRAQTGHDFSQYKPSTVQRRIERRMALHRINAMGDYAEYIEQTPAEAEALFSDLLIGVTRFFRDSEAFKTLEQLVIPKLFAGKEPGATIRVWCPGCSTGEEPYSIAMLLQEHMERLGRTYNAQIFATDIDGRAIVTGRAGLYSASIAADISPERLAGHFSAEPGSTAYRIHKGIRDMLVFSEQDVVRDPPFSKLDLISCRNLLIYMGPELQKKLIPLFHYALVPGGYLFLGTSETAGEFTNMFVVLDRKAKLYQQQESSFRMRQASRPPAIRSMTAPTGSAPQELAKPTAARKVPLRELTERALLQHCSLAGALVNAHGDILYIHGRSGNYLEPTPGESGINNILKMAREGLRRELALALHDCANNKEIVHYAGLRVACNGKITSVNLTIRPAASDPASTPLYLVVLEEAPSTVGEKDTVRADSDDSDGNDRVAALQQELRAKDDYIQTTIDELETSNEVIQSSNEEMQSINEELQSTNEELETSKEELQSTNEELATVNAELQTKIVDLSRANNDMNNLLSGTSVATVFVDHELCVLRFTPTAKQIINLIESDVGRPVGHIVSNLVGNTSLVADAESVLKTLIPKEAEVQTRDGRWYMMRILPYRTVDNVIEGAVITFADVTTLKRAEDTLREVSSLRALAAVVRDANDAVMVQNMDGDILTWNPAAERMYGWSEDEALAMNISELTPVNLREEARTIARWLGMSEVMEPFGTQRITKDGGTVDVWLTATALVNETGTVYAIATTERKRMDGKPIARLVVPAPGEDR